MKLLAVITKSSGYIESFYQRHPRLGDRPYAEQSAEFAADMFGGSEIWSSGLQPFGYQTGRIFENVPALQKRWADENGVPYDPANWRQAVVAAQISQFQPEILVVANYAAFSAEFIRQVRNDNPALRLVIGWCGSPHRRQAVFREFDFILSNIPELVADFKTNGLCSYHLNPGFDPRALERIDRGRAPDVDFSFVGSVIKAEGFHMGREALLLDLIAATPLQIWAPLRRLTLGQRVQRRAVQLGSNFVRRLQQGALPLRSIAALPMLRRLASIDAGALQRSMVDRRIVRRARPPLYGLPMLQKLRDSRVTLNTHGEISPNTATNMRLYEATGAGTCLLTDWKRNLVDLFEPEVEVVTYRDSAECIDKVRYLLQNETARQAIAAAGQQRTLREHTIFRRAEQLDEIIRQHLKRSYL